jgi:hypothetical protein
MEENEKSVQDKMAATDLPIEKKVNSFCNGENKSGDVDETIMHKTRTSSDEINSNQSLGKRKSLLEKLSYDWYR